MKTISALLIIMLLPLLGGFVFDIDPGGRSMTAYSPILMNKNDLAASVYNQPVREFDNPGKIYLYENMIFIVDNYRGIHVIDNHDPATPQKTGFIHIPGVMDLSVRNNVLFADNSIDLVSVDISNYPQIAVLDRKEDVFPEPTPPDLEWIPYAYSSSNRPLNTIIVGWVK